MSARFVALLAGCLLAALPARVQEPRQESAAEFERGVEAYRAGRFAEARTHWLDALDPELPPRERARVHYDLGNAAWRLEAPLEAVLRFTAAVRLDPRNGAAWKNLELARAAAGLEPADRGDLRSTLARALGALRPEESRALVLAALLGWLLLLAGETFVGGRWWRRAAGLGALGVVLAALPWIASLVRGDDERGWMVVRSGEVALRSEPLDTLEAIGSLASGEEVRRLDALPGWIEVERGDGLAGWTKAEGLLPVFPERAGAP